jgi:hypothetical protein
MTSPSYKSPCLNKPTNNLKHLQYHQNDRAYFDANKKSRRGVRVKWNPKYFDVFL